MSNVIGGGTTVVIIGYYPIFTKIEVAVVVDKQQPDEYYPSCVHMYAYSRVQSRYRVNPQVCNTDF